MIKKRIILLISITVVFMLVVLVAFYIKVSMSSPWAILPTESTPSKLTIVKYGGPDIRKIIVKHITKDNVVKSHVLELNVSLASQIPQEYELPLIKGGRVEISVDFEDGVLADNDKVLTVTYEDADEVYNSGILIYSAGDLGKKITIDGLVYYNQYLHFISGNKKISYIEPAGGSEWEERNDLPKPKSKTPTYKNSYFPNYDSGWREKNKWKHE